MNYILPRFCMPYLLPQEKMAKAVLTNFRDAKEYSCIYEENDISVFKFHRVDKFGTMYSNFIYFFAQKMDMKDLIVTHGECLVTNKADLTAFEKIGKKLLYAAMKQLWNFSRT